MKFQGIMPALLTPYDSAGRVSEGMLRRLASQYLDLGIDGLYLCGGAGEGILLHANERKQIAEVVIDEVRGRAPVIVHVGAVSTEDAAELAAHAEGAGANAVASVPPFFYHAGPEAIYQHYSAIAQRTGLPLLIYNIPFLTGVTITPAIVTRLMEIPTVAGIKFSSNDLFQMRQIVELDGGRLQVFSGNDEICLAALVMGAHGAIGLTFNFMPKLFIDIFANFRLGHLERAQELQFLASRIIGVLAQYSSIPATKEIMRWKGYEVGSARSPLEKLTDEQKNQLRAQLEEIGFFELALGI